MDFKDSNFEIIKNHNCPLYQTKDRFNVDGRSVSLMGKPACITLISDITQALLTCQGLQSKQKKQNAEHTFNCSGYQSGCAGTIRLRYLLGTPP